MAIARDEIFGPVLCVIPYRDEAEAVAIANDTDYGLSAMVLGGDVARAHRVAQQIVSGRVLVNTLAHEPKAPFGGFKHSGVGREMGEVGNSRVYGAQVSCGLNPARWRSRPACRGVTCRVHSSNMLSKVFVGKKSVNSFSARSGMNPSLR
ncbi:aldehyde dehydrogenase [Enterobacter cancerogenus]|uniref:Aldehyde dehydrogenase n=1 Tax=Enterobacter cancerogenus TaxID=69218 RepID=A0A484Z8F3_9ENTR|nr:aldehyde dehydrogenase [Enterobacter cancerogenus]